MSKKINGEKYKKIAVAYVKQDSKGRKDKKESGVYNTLDRLERIMRAVSAVNRAIVGYRDPTSPEGKKRLKKSKKYAKLCKKNGMLVLKKQKAIRSAKPAKALKRAKQ